MAVRQRPEWMSLLARAPSDVLAERWSQAGLDLGFHWMRRPETGSVMIRGRTGGSGAPFNLGEMTVTRCALRLGPEGASVAGHSTVPGRDKEHARIAALCDALMQTDAAERVEKAILTPIEMALAASARNRAAKAAATKVEFFTMVRGENA